jgi:hypothetical protein
MKDVTVSTLHTRYHIAAPEELHNVVERGNREESIVLFDIVSNVILPLVRLIIPQFTLGYLQNEPVLGGFGRGLHMPVHGRIAVVGIDGGLAHRFEIRDISGGWHSPFGENPATLHILN